MINSFTGKPYNFRTYNCWTHVRAVRSAAGFTTPDFDVSAPTMINAAFDAGHDDSKGLTKHSAPQNFDAVLLGIRHAGRIVWHAGVYYDGMVSHCELASRQVRLEPLSEMKERFTEIEFWR